MTDLVSGFFQCAIDKGSFHLTAECTQDGLWERTVMPQGLASSPACFQSIMLRVCEGLERVKLFIDDIVCFSKNGEQHVCDLRRFLERLTRFNLKLAPNNALLGTAEIIFLGHDISSEGVGPHPGKVKAMKEMSMPRNVSQLRSLLGALSDGNSPRWPLEHDRPTPCYEKESSSRYHRLMSALSEKRYNNCPVLTFWAFPDFESAISGFKKIPARYGYKRRWTRCCNRTSTTRRFYSAPPLPQQPHSQQ